MRKDRIKAIIVDDERLARENLEDLVKEHCPEIELVGEAGNVSEAKQMIISKEPDLVFLDIKLANATGFDLLDQLENRPFGVIFVTAYDSYAIKAIRFSAIDYLLKPVNPKEMKAAVDKFGYKNGLDKKAMQLELLIENLSKERAFNRLAVNVEGSMELLVVSNIYRLQGESNYTRIFMKGGTSILVSKTLVEFEELLGELGFFRVHKTHIVNLSKITSFKKYTDFSVVLEEGTVVPVSRRRKVGLEEKLKTN